jgi:isoleucyl-tRNA synthetase
MRYQADSYRRLRNTLRFLLGNLTGFSEDERLPVEDMPELERWVLHRVTEIDAEVRSACLAYDFHALFAAIHNFCAMDLSAFYFDIRKDSLYCDPLGSPRRRAARTVLDTLFDCLTAWLAPILVFTAEEAWLNRFPSDDDSVHLRLFPDIPEEWRDDALAAKWTAVRRLRRVVTGALEIERREKRIGSSLQADPKVHVDSGYIQALSGLDLAELLITSAATLTEDEPNGDAFMLEDVAGVAVTPGLAQGGKCERCWKLLPEVGEAALCGRCSDAVAAG